MKSRRKFIKALTGAAAGLTAIKPVFAKSQPETQSAVINSGWDKDKQKFTDFTIYEEEYRTMAPRVIQQSIDAFNDRDWGL